MHVGIANWRGEENVPGIPGACVTRNFTYLARGPWVKFASIKPQQSKAQTMRKIHGCTHMTWFDIYWIRTVKPSVKTNNFLIVLYIGKLAWNGMHFLENENQTKSKNNVMPIMCTYRTRLSILFIQKDSNRMSRMILIHNLCHAILCELFDRGMSF